MRVPPSVAASKLAGIVPRVRGWGARAALVLAVLLAGAPPLAAPLAAQEAPGAASRVFGRFAERVVKIQVVESGASANAGIGTGFFVSGDGHVVTNYHVIADVVHDPDRYRAELVDGAGAATGVEVLAIDVVHDLAVLLTDVTPPAHFTLAPATTVQGTRLYSLGHPSDLGLSIVEGTYNGLLQHTLYPKIHFTGSINPGMSGGPTITADGRVVGINVSTYGNQLSFLVPVERAAALVERATAPGYRPPDDLLARVAIQVRMYQERYLQGMFAGKVETVELGSYRVPTEPAPFFRCWGDATRNDERPYETVRHYCSTDDYLYIAGDQRSGIVEIEHELLLARSLNPFRFYALYSSVFGFDNTPAGAEEHVTRWSCATRNVRNETTPLRAVLCVRGYRKLDALYDAVLKVAVLGRRDSGLVSTLTLSGVTYDNIEALTERYLESVTAQ